MKKWNMGWKCYGMLFLLICSFCLQMMPGNFVEAAEDVKEEVIGGTGLKIGPNGHVYKVFICDDYTWEDAKKACEGMNGHLATITSEEEQKFVEQVNESCDSLWIGGYRDDAYIWYWVTGEAWFYTNWKEGEPNDSSNVVSNERYVTLWPTQWNDLANENISEQTGYLCEWESTDLVPGSPISPIDPSENEYDDKDELTKLSTPKIKSIKSTYQGVVIKWSEIEDADSYTITRNGEEIATTQDSSFLDNNMPGGVACTYEIVADGDEELFTSSDTAIARIGQLPKRVSKLKASKEKKRLVLSWQKVDGAEKYIVLRSATKNGDYKKVATVKKASYTKKNPKKGYYYKVVVQAKDVFSPASKGIKG